MSSLPSGWDYHEYNGKTMKWRINSDCGNFRIYKVHYGPDLHRYQLWQGMRRWGEPQNTLQEAISNASSD